MAGCFLCSRTKFSCRLKHSAYWPSIGHGSFPKLLPGWRKILGAPYMLQAGSSHKFAPAFSPQTHSQNCLEVSCLIPAALYIRYQPRVLRNWAMAKEDSASGQMKIFLQSSFFKQNEDLRFPRRPRIRAISKKSDNTHSTSFNCPPPAMIPSSDLVLKYGADVTCCRGSGSDDVAQAPEGQVSRPWGFWLDWRWGSNVYKFISSMKYRLCGIDRQGQRFS